MIRRAGIAIVLAGMLAALVGTQQVAAAPACTVTWKAAVTTGNWDLASNWMEGRVPGLAADVACIPAGVTVTYRSASQTTTIMTLLNAGTLTMTGGTLNLTGTGGNESTAATLDLQAGTLGGAGTLAVSGTLTWIGGTMQDAGTTRIAPAATLVRDGANTVFLATGRRLRNEGTVDLRSDRFISPSGLPASLLHNVGTVLKSAGAGTATLAVPVQNDGTLRSDSGALDLRGGGSSASATGTFGAPSAAAGSVLLSVGTFGLADGARLIGGVNVAGATVNVDDAATAVASGANAMSGGVIGGTGTLDVTGTVTWTGGTMQDAGTTRITSTGTLVRDGANTVFLATGRRLRNEGTVDLRSDRFISPSGLPASLLVNAGTIVKSAGAGTATLAVPVQNDGTMRSDAGTLDLRGGGGSLSATGTFGSPTAAADSVLLSVGTFGLADQAKLLGGVTLSGGTVNVDDGAIATASGNNAMTGGIVGATGTLDVTGTLTWSGGTMQDAGTTRIAPAGNLIRDGANTVFLATGRMLRNDGTIDLRSDRFISSSGTPAAQIVNTGTVRKSAGAGAAVIAVPLRNDGLVESTSGRLELDAGTATVTHSGRFRGASATAVAAFERGTHILAAGADLDGTTEIGGSAIVGVAQGETVGVEGELRLTAGELRGPGTVEVTGVLKWTGGTQAGPGTTLIPTAGRFDVGGPGSACTVGLRDQRLLDNRGTTRILGGTRINTFGAVPPAIDNAGAMTIDDTNRGACGDPGIAGTGIVRNSGTIEKLGDTGKALLTAGLDNDGQVRVTSGSLSMRSTATAVHTGSFRGVGGPVAFSVGTFALGPGAHISGQVDVDGAEVRLPEALEVVVGAADTLRLVGGSLVGGQLNILGTSVWTGGSRAGAGTTVVEPGATLTVGVATAGSRPFIELGADQSLVNRGLLDVLQAEWDVRNGASILNAGTMRLAGGTRVDGDDFGVAGGFASLLHNTGTLTKGGGDATTLTVPFDNDGTLEVTQGTLTLGRVLNWSADAFAASGTLTGGTWIVRDAAQLGLPGALATNAARLVLGGPGAGLQYDDGDPAPADALALLRLNAGAGRLEVAGGKELAIPGALHNAGTVRIAAGSKLTATGGYSQAASGAVLRTELASPAGLGRLETPATASLGGRLDAEHAPGFAPADGQEFAVIVAGTVTGTFSSVTGTDLGSGLELEALYDAAAVRLRVRPSGGEPGAAAVEVPPSDSATAPDAEPQSPPPLRVDDRAFAIASGPWTRTSAGGATVSIATHRGATLVRRGVTARSLALLARTCRACGAVDVRFRGRLLARVSLRSARPGRRLLPVSTFATGRTGTVTLRTASARRVTIDALVVGL